MSIKKILKRILAILLVTIALVFGFGYWFISLIKTDRPSVDVSKTQATDLPYLVEDSIAYRGKILAVVTSTSKINESKKTGYELTELSRAYYVFTANGFEVDIASPQGGNPPVVIDDDDIDVYDFAFMNDAIATMKVENTISLESVIPEEYDAVYFVGGKGAMFDFPNNPNIQSIVRDYYESDKVIGAVCHGPAALINVTLSNGQSLLSRKKVSGFTNEEELFLIPDAEEIFPFLLQDEMVSKGAQFNAGTMYLKNVVKDDKLITGQNPWSTWELAEEMIRSMGFIPKEREMTSEEASVQILLSYEKDGYGNAKTKANELLAKSVTINRELIAVHSITSIMQGDFIRSVNLIKMLSFLKNKN
ncbi:type 1 glutamine amidotransferase domain-containing protein [Ekhidna sp. To15]|uniref:type 1 glutamine amidotransferase domain-containing protein n=1 Tax=Ekhidna sp. To15 TaxID=3395267 RepID=UPI003F521625